MSIMFSTDTAAASTQDQEPELNELEEERLENGNIVGYEASGRTRTESDPRGTRDEEDDLRFDDGVDLYLAPGALNYPYGGEEDIDYEDAFDPGYQWGVGLGYFVRTDSPFAITVGGFFDHAIVNAESRDLGSGDFDHVFRLGLELKPGFVIKDRLFLYVPLRGGYASQVLDFDGDLDAEHGPMFGVGAGLDVALTEHFYVGTVVGTDLHFFRSGEDYELYSLAWRTHLGFRF